MPVQLRIDDGRTEQNRDSGVGAKFRKGYLRLFVIDVCLRADARRHQHRNVTVVFAQEVSDLVRHRTGADRTEDRRDVSKSQVAAKTSKPLHYYGLGPHSRRSHRRAHAGRPATGHGHVNVKPRLGRHGQSGPRILRRTSTGGCKGDHRHPLDEVPSLRVQRHCHPP